MIIACPACGTRYAVPDSAIGVGGRTVRCAKCRHSWFQDGPELPLAPAPAPPPPPVPAPTPAPPPVVEDEPGTPVAEEPIAREPAQPNARPGFGDDALQRTPAREPAPPPAPPAFAEPEAADEPDAEAEDPGEVEPPEPIAADAVPPPPSEDWADEDEDYSQFDSEPPFRKRRNPLKMWTIAAVIFAIIALGTVLAANYWGLPDWVPVSRPTFGLGQADLVLDFPADQQDRRELPDGTEFFGVSGSITNVGRETHTLPPILIVLRDERDRIVYKWEIPPPKTSLAPGTSVSINQAVRDVPKAAKFAEIGWKPG